MRSGSQQIRRPISAHPAMLHRISAVHCWQKEAMLEPLLPTAYFLFAANR
jgi:hypothetical protein